MKKVIGFFCLFLFAAGGYLLGYKEIKRTVYKRQLLPNMNWAKKMDVVREQKPFVVTIPSYRNEKFCEKNLRSVFEQKYENYRVIYVDDASPDRTYERVKELVTEWGQWHRFTLLKNENNRGAMYNHAQMSQYYGNEEIVVMLDGDDWFASDEVLQELNRYYANPDVWVTYGQYITYPGYQVGLCKPMSFSNLKKGNVRELPWVTSALRTFYGGLFRRIQMEDFLFGDVFLPMSCDPAYMFPIVEMAREHVYFTQDIGYVYNRNTGINDDLKSRAKQLFFEKFCRMQPAYPALLEHPATPLRDAKVKNSDVVIFAADRPVELFATLESLLPHQEQIGEVTVFCAAGEEKMRSAYQRLMREYPHVRWVLQQECKEALHRVLQKPMADHVLFLSEGTLVDENVHLRVCAQDMENAGAFCYCLNIDKGQVPTYQHVITLRGIHEGLYGIVFSSSDRAAWEGQSLFYANLYRKGTVQEWLNEMDTLRVEEFWTKWPFHHDGRSSLFACTEKPSAAHIYQITQLPQEFFATQALDRFVEGNPYAACFAEQVIAEAI